MTEPPYITEARDTYDLVADDYEVRLRGDLERRSFDRAMLAAFAELVDGQVADLGCGPGRITAHLDSLGLSAFGIDLSPGMVAVARRRYPDLRFTVGSMLALDLPDNSVAGAVAWYSIIHTDPSDLPVLFAELHRVVAPGGYLLVAFKDGDERRHLKHAYGHDLSLRVYWLPTARVSEMLGAVGFAEVARLVRAAEPPEASAQGYLIMRKPA
ncbi:class I SAM-dependent DNA methyltransferase [Actinokineospora globicatena]|uniref:Methyltransferase n=1 Tax=Actinokineospora globicatena TaxID=103729 RepID=A0A9W6QQW6_9PSEU|nr:class I SAM-dependent methyltransferase [Actinokineospora globicatena]GLW94883.1 methyltransferase [Actinokineospora globicatena]